MTSPINSADFELVSAYLDKQLDPKELLKVETRLKTEPELNALFTSLQRTKHLIRQAPSLRVPRSFVLSRDLSQVKRPIFSGWTSLNFASAIASFLLLVTFIGDLSVNPVSLPFAGAAAPADEQAPQTLMAEAATSTPEVEMFAQDRQVKTSEPVADYRQLFAENARQIELVLAGVAITTGLLARRGRKT